ncbi:MAG: hypothetical protein KY428_03875 [Bacteroidetes bacterium]|nr:hypothetical protein [Bacteroidota bacterium]
MIRSFPVAALCLLLLAGVFSCNQQHNTLTTEAKLRWTGMIAADGCGFFLDIDGQEYKPVNEEVIPEHFQQQETMRVRLTYEMQDKPLEYSCGMIPARPPFKAIKIIEINNL